ncbi:unnamed protein product, partial [Ectocarpus sp. 12 AP-2014]
MCGVPRPRDGPTLSTTKCSSAVYVSLVWLTPLRTLAFQGKHTEVNALFTRCQAIQENLVGPEHPTLVTTLNNRAILLKSQAKHPEAERLDERC